VCFPLLPLKARFFHDDGFSHDGSIWLHLVPDPDREWLADLKYIFSRIESSTISFTAAQRKQNTKKPGKKQATDME
jgi:hypothetical protein